MNRQDHRDWGSSLEFGHFPLSWRCTDGTGVGHRSWPTSGTIDGRSRVGTLKIQAGRVDGLRVRVGIYVHALKLYDMDSRPPGGEGLDRLGKIRGSHFLELGLGTWTDPHAEEEDCHHVRPHALGVRLLHYIRRMMHGKSFKGNYGVRSCILTFPLPLAIHGWHQGRHRVRRAGPWGRSALKSECWGPIFPMEPQEA